MAKSIGGSANRPTPVKHVFFDIVQFTQLGRNTPVQKAILSAFNGMVTRSLKQLGLDVMNPEQVIPIPTGDGVCVCIIGTTDNDIHVRLALKVLAGVHSYNTSKSSEKQRFTTRIGINYWEDIIVTDIRGQQNVAGKGINTAQRVMNAADGNTILFTDDAYKRFVEHWQPRDKSVFFRVVRFHDKHGNAHIAHQYVDMRLKSLNNTEITVAKRTTTMEWKRINAVYSLGDYMRQIHTLLGSTKSSQGKVYEMCDAAITEYAGCKFGDPEIRKGLDSLLYHILLIQGENWNATAVRNVQKMAYDVMVKIYLLLDTRSDPQSFQ